MVLCTFSYLCHVGRLLFSRKLGFVVVVFTMVECSTYEWLVLIGIISFKFCLVSGGQILVNINLGIFLGFCFFWGGCLYFLMPKSTRGFVLFEKLVLLYFILWESIAFSFVLQITGFLKCKCHLFRDLLCFLEP